MPDKKTIKIQNIELGHAKPLVLIAGPCVIESEELAFQVAQKLKTITSRLNMPWIFKASYDKANRTSADSFRGPGLEKGLDILARIKRQIQAPILSDVHCRSEIEPACRVLDVVQIPAFLARQTDLLSKAAANAQAINIKKGQFLSPHDMANQVKKAELAGAKNILLTERGTTFGYGNLVVDMRGLSIMADLGYPVVFDATHSVQLPGGLGKASSGEREYIPLLARAAVAAGVDAVFMEVHPSPEQALCDGPNSIRIDDLEPLLVSLQQIHRLVMDNR